MGTFLDYFPRIPYDISRTGARNFDLITDVFFRFKFLDKVKKMKVAYLPYILRNNETPESLADRFYGDPQAHWIILMVNDIVDPHTDWYKDETTFEKYLIDKYGSIAAAFNTVHHYEKTVSTQIGNENMSNTTSQIDYTDIQYDGSNSFSTIYSTIPYSAYSQMPEVLYESAVGASNRLITVSTFRDSVSCYDYEVALNEKRQSIKLIYPESYPQIRQEFEKLVAEYNPARRLNYRAVKV